MITRPLAVTVGEPAGIGPELCLALAASGKLDNAVVLADPSWLVSLAERLGIRVRVREVEAADLGRRCAGDGELLVLSTAYPETPVPGSPNRANASAVLETLRIAVAECLRKRFSGLVTAPVHKAVINDAGIRFTGHTEYLAELTNTECPVMLLVAGELRVALVTTHLPLRQVVHAVTGERLHAVLDTLIEGLRTRFRIADPEIIVCGLNPHAGEGGHLGTEDASVIEPVVAEFAARGHRVRGPVPADTAFVPTAGHGDAVLAMFHDQGLPVLKFAGFGHAVNVTLGLPIVRTSVDHGTAFDIAGTGTADTGSLLAAVRLARELAETE